MRAIVMAVRGVVVGAAKGAVHELRLLLTAVQFLTRVPVPAWVGFDVSWLAACLRYFPLVGAGVGAGGVGTLALGVAWWPPEVAVLLAMAATVYLTGGFHEDGWADSCDGLGGAVSRERALLIMKDSRLGTYGALGLVFMLALKAAVLVAMLAPTGAERGADARAADVQTVLLVWAGLAWVWAHTLSRWLAVLLIACLPYAGDADHAKAKPLAMQASPGVLLAATLVTLGVAASLGLALAHQGWPLPTWWQAMGASTAAALAVALWWGWGLRRRLGGFTGDTLGAMQQLGELAVLLAWLAVVHPQRLIHG